MILFSHVIIFWMVASRLSGFMVLAPGIQDIQAPTLIRAAVVIWLSCFLTPMLVETTHVSEQPYDLIVAVLGEFAFGLGLGLVTRLVLTTVQIGGSLIDNELALSAAQQLSPQAGISGGVLGRMQLFIGLAFFWISDYFSALILGIQQSFRVLPIGHIHITAASLDQIAQLGGELFAAGLILASPIAILSFVVTIALGFLSRSVPHLNVFGESFTLRVLLGTTGLIVFLPLLLGMSRYWLERMLPAAADYFRAMT